MGRVSTVQFTAFLLAAAWSAAAMADDAADPATRGAQLFAERCALCHASTGAGGGQGPSLAGVMGRKAAATAFAYSPALRRTGWVWDEIGRAHV